MNMIEATCMGLAAGMENPNPTAARVAKPVGEISSPQEIADLAQALTDNRGNVRNTGTVASYGARYSKRADQVSFDPIQIDPSLIDRAVNVRLAIPNGIENDLCRAVKGMVDTPRRQWVGCPSNSLIKEVLDNCEAYLASRKVEAGAVDRMIKEALLTSTV